LINVFNSLYGVLISAIKNKVQTLPRSWQTDSTSYRKKTIDK